MYPRTLKCLPRRLLTQVGRAQWLADNKCPEDICVFFSEVRNIDGEEYTPRSIAHILAGLQRFMNEKRSPDHQLRISDIEFKELHKS